LEKWILLEIPPEEPYRAWWDDRSSHTCGQFDRSTDLDEDENEQNHLQSHTPPGADADRLVSHHSDREVAC